MGNTASKQLSELNALSQGAVDAVDAVDAQDALDQIQPGNGSQRVPRRDKDGRAQFGTGEALATTILSSIILTPAGALLLGGAQGLLKKKSDQALLDQIANQENALTDAAAVYDQQLTDFKAAATNPDDLAQIGTMEAQKTVALGLMTSGDPGLQSAGLDAFVKFEENLQNYAQTQETQRIAGEAKDAQLLVELGDRQFSRYTGLQSDFDSQSAGYLSRQEAAATALRALESGTPAALHAAMILFNKTLDPNSAVLGEERTAIVEMGSLLDQAYNFLNGGFSGEQMNSEQRRKLGDAIVSISQTSTEFQMRREASFSDRAIDAELPVKFLDNFRLVENIPTTKTPDIEPDLAEQALIADREARARQSMLIGDAVDAAKETVGNIREGVPGAIDAFGQFLDDFSRAASGGPRDTNRPTN